MKKSLLTLTALTALILTGCNSVSEQVTAAAGGKNLALDGYVMYGSVETADSDTGTPTGKLIIGRLTYKSRKVGIPAVDTNAMTTRLFALDYHDQSTELVDRLADGNAKRYDLFFLCGDDIPYADTPDRSGDQKRHEFQQIIIQDLQQRQIDHKVLTGSLPERIEQVKTALRTFCSAVACGCARSQQ